MLRKLIVVYNPRASQQAVIEREVLTPLRTVTGWLVSKYEVKKLSLAENVAKLKRIVSDDDLVVAVGGDGTATMAANAVLASGTKACFAALPYGNFNDVARISKIKRPVEYGDSYIGGLMEVLEKFAAGKIREIYPLEVKVNGKHWRYALSYVTVGMFAQSTRVFEGQKVRKKLKTGKRRLVFSIWQLAKWYFKHHKNDFMPTGELKRLGDEEIEIMIEGKGRWPVGTTDYIAVNGPRMARVMKGGKWLENQREFRSTLGRLGNFWRLMGFMLRSIMIRVPGKRTNGEVLSFGEPSTLVIQTEGEAEELEKVKEIEVVKAQGLRVVVR